MISPQNTRPPAHSLSIITRSPEETRLLGEIIGRAVGETEKIIITLTGDLGAGKTVLVQGLARGLSVPEEYYITSPTYTLINEYPGRVRLAHADLYRIDDGMNAAGIDLEETLDRNGVLVVEWANRLPGGYLSEDLAIRISTPSKNETDDTRHIALFFYGRPKINLIDRLKNTFLDN